MKKNRNAEPRLDGDNDRSDGVGYVFPEDIEDRIHRHREASGLTWSVLAKDIDVERRPDRRCRRGIGGRR